MISEPALNRLHQLFGKPDVGGTRYELRSVLGEGGMGVVYLAQDRVLDREVALKVLDRADASGAARLEQEARILARLEHPGIVPVHDCGELADGRMFYAMKRVRGRRLDHWVATGADVRARLDVFLRICEAVAFAHAHGVIHRDLKPENVMVGEFGEVLVLDWGLATVKGMDRGASSGSGTPAYIAPEQARGEAVDDRADVYALGAILAGIGDGIPALLAIAARARQVDRANRYASVQELSAEIARFQAGAAVAAHRESMVAMTARLVRRYRVPIGLVLVYLLMRFLLLWAFRV